MKNIIFGSSTHPLRLEFPVQWAKAVDGKVNISINDEDGNELLASTATTLIGSATLTDATVIGDTSFTTANAYSFVRGDRLRINTSTSGPGEEVIVKHKDGSVIHLEEEMDYAHKNGTDIYGMFATYTLDASSSTNYPLGRRVRVKWDPVDATLDAITDIYEVTDFVFDLAGFKIHFENVYPSEYQIAGERFEHLFAALKKKVIDYLEPGSNLNRAVETSLFDDVFLEGMCWYVNSTIGGNQREYEAKMAKGRYDTALAALQKRIIWFDENQDGTKTDEELKSIFKGPTMRGWA